ncbi:hypothetical protein LRH25_24895 [Ideonella azotifigens]|uniref:Beta-lactamase-related domain-containing protein n=1 Tax=Ideonella azotifigens TaxID=513160 RepID=A0ABP3UR71_9BURK|nr:hypothetical protein [Ideonella azotifigens]MCD2343570.1 hypothetical protein [Ideonella azotifigens]
MCKFQVRSGAGAAALVLSFVSHVTAGAAAPPPGFAGPTANSLLAAKATAQDNALCSQALLGPFYWEIGDASQILASGQVGSDDSVLMRVASASKWVYGAYVVEVRGGQARLDPENDLPFLNFTSGYSNMGNMSAAQACAADRVNTVDDCMKAVPGGSQQNSATTGKFDYDSGHLQKHASLNSMGDLANPDLSAGALNTLGVPFIYGEPLLAGGLYTNASTYRQYLQRLLAGALKMSNALGTHPVCTNPSDLQHGCSPALALPGPIPSNESWHYSLGHWVEDDPAVGDGAFSSPGSFGFYPWIEAGKRYYGILARDSDGDQQGYVSAQCGRLIRHAWLTGREQKSSAPD